MSDEKQDLAEQSYEVIDVDGKSEFDIKWVDYTDGGGDRRLYGELRTFGIGPSVRLVVQPSDNHNDQWQWGITSFGGGRQINLSRDGAQSAETAQAQCEQAFRAWLKLEGEFIEQNKKAPTDDVPDDASGVDGPGSA